MPVMEARRTGSVPKAAAHALGVRAGDAHDAHDAMSVISERIFS